MSDKISDYLLEGNNQYMVFSKPAGMNVQPDPTGDESLLKLASAYAKRNVFLLHRLDRPVSGVVVFPKTKNTLQNLERQFRERTATKVYLALVKKAPPETQGTLVHYLKKDGRKKRAVAYDKPTEGSKRAELSYRTLATSDTYTLLEVELLTGRFHQIRAQLSAIGSPVKGDVKYGARRANRDRSIGLHAWKLGFDHPINGKRVLVTAPPPNEQPWSALMAQVGGSSEEE